MIHLLFMPSWEQAQLSPLLLTLLSKRVVVAFVESAALQNAIRFIAQGFAELLLLSAVGRQLTVPYLAGDHALLSVVPGGGAFCAVAVQCF